MKPLSFSQISLYQSCPLCYKLQYIDKLKGKDKGYFSFGTMMHLCAQYFFRVNVPPPPALDELLQFYDENWLSEGYESAEEETRYRAYGRDILAKFWEIHQEYFRPPIATEKLFNIDIDGVKLRGYIDRVDKLPGGGLAIIDYKTTRELFTAEHLENDLQLTLYQIAAEQLWKLPVAQLTLYHLRSNTACTCAPRQPAQLAQARQLVSEVAENIARSNFPATENQFCPCDFPEYCPYYRHQYPVPQAELTLPLPEPASVTAETVEEYASLQKQIKELQSKLDEVKQQIISFCQTQNLNRVYSKEHAITYKMVDRTGFEENAIRTLLEQSGLWEKVLSFDPAQVKQLISDESIAPNIREQLGALRQVISSSPQLWLKKRASEEE
ncbi:MAG: PD-(D/E)XK nuclease family protein [Dehalococcoidales bacterium]|nr:PD-(D/E)XK nuclease family protein [Dehalococcoidales bacterium]